MTLKEFVERWPLLQQIRHGLDGTGLEARSERTRSLRPKHHDAQVAHSVCPYCGVGCGQLVYHRDGKLISIEGNARITRLTRPALPERLRQLRASHPHEPFDQESDIAGRARPPGRTLSSRRQWI